MQGLESGNISLEKLFESDENLHQKALDLQKINLLLDPVKHENFLLEQRKKARKQYDLKQSALLEQEIEKRVQEVMEKGKSQQKPFSRLKKDPSYEGQGKTFFYVVPHTHTDLGWLKTVDEYYKSHVKEILDSVVENLWLNSRRYLFHDVGFVEMWWKDATEIQKTKFRNLVTIGRLEIANGSISMNDLVTTRVFESETNLYHGRTWCQENLGITSHSKTAWMIDPFGIPKTQYQLLHNLGFRNLVLNRISFDKKDHRKESRNLTFWAKDPLQSSSAKNSDPLLVHVMHGHYNLDEVILPDNKWIELNPMQEKFKEIKTTLSRILRYLEKTRKQYSTNLVMLPYGDDFSHRQFGKTMARMEGFIVALKSNPSTIFTDERGTPLQIDFQNFEFDFSTASEYFEDLRTKLHTDKTAVVTSEYPQFVPYRDQDKN